MGLHSITPDQPSSRPHPGPAGVRPIWDGESAAPPPTLILPLEPEKLRWTTDRAFGPSFSPKRITGLDAARGCALLGMIAVHILPASNEKTGRPMIVWDIFAGHAAALFAVLAGVTVALSTGSNDPHTGRKMCRSRVSLAVRAILILALGLALDHLDIDILNILPYYGLMFLFAIPLTTLRIRWLLALAMAFSILGPLAVFSTNARVDYTLTRNPDFSSLYELPIDTLITLFVGGTYPLITWMTYLCFGLAVGRLNLRWLLTSARLIVVGAVVAATSALLSASLIDYGGGFENLYYYTDGYSEEDILNILDYGPDEHLPTDTLWWLAVNGPHTDTTFSLLASSGLAVFVIGVFLFVARMLRSLLFPLIAVGSMTLTLYVLHALTFAVFLDSIMDSQFLWFFAQVIAAFLIASAWHLTRGRGPLEEIVSRICKGVSRVLVPDTPQESYIKERKT